jgi:hypothetical protein
MEEVYTLLIDRPEFSRNFQRSFLRELIEIFRLGNFRALQEN